MYLQCTFLDVSCTQILSLKAVRAEWSSDSILISYVCFPPYCLLQLKAAVVSILQRSNEIIKQIKYLKLNLIN